MARDRPHVLFVMDRWCDLQRRSGPSNVAHNFVGSLEATGLATFTWLTPDDGPQPAIGEVQRVVRSESPDLIIMVFDPGNLPLLNWHAWPDPSPPVVALWHDTGAGACVSMADRVPFVTMHVALDSTTSWRAKGGNPQRWVSLWTPQDPRLFYNPGRSRDLPVIFLGTIVMRSDRQAMVRTLREAGVPVYQRGGQREDKLSIADYASFLQRSQISLNTAGNTDGSGQVICTQVKGRVFETLACGALLVEEANVETAAWLEPGRDYVPFGSAEELVDRTRFYLAHDQARQAIAACGQARMEQDYSARAWWQTIFACSKEA